MLVQLPSMLNKMEGIPSCRDSRQGFSRRSINLQRQTDDPAIRTPEHLWGMKLPLVLFDLLLAQAGKMVTVRRRSA